MAGNREVAQSQEVPALAMCGRSSLSYFDCEHAVVQM